MKRVRVRRDHPYAPAWTLVMLLTALTLYLITEGARAPNPRAVSAPVEQVSCQLEPLDLNLLVLSRARDEASARIEAARYMPRGAAGYILPGTGEYLIVGAGYDSADEAARVMQKLEEEHLTASLAARGSPGLSLRLTGTRAQTDALLNAERALRAQTAVLGETAFSLDAGAIQIAGAREALLSARADARKAREALEQAAGAAVNPAAQGLLSLLFSLEDSATTMLFDNQPSPLFFSSQMKYNYIDLRLRHIDFINRLADGA